MKQLLQALIKAKAEIKNPSKDNKAEVRRKDSPNVSYTYFYTDLATVVNTITPALVANGLLVVQSITVVEDDVVVSTTLYHESGESLEIDKLQMPCNPNDAQSIGSASTYGRRYALMALFCLAGEDDDGANAQRQVRRRAPAAEGGQGGAPAKRPDEGAFLGFQQAVRGMFDKYRVPPEDRDELVAAACSAVNADVNDIEKETRANLAKVYRELERLMESRQAPAAANERPARTKKKAGEEKPLLNPPENEKPAEGLPKHDPTLAPPGTLSPEYEEIRGQLRVVLNRSGHWDSEQHFLDDLVRVCQEEMKVPFDHIKRTHDKALILKLYQRMAEIGGIEEPAEEEEVIV